MAYLIGAGTTLARRTATSPVTYTAISQVKSITPPELTMGTVETTHLTSTGREFMPTIPDGGEVSFELEYDPADAQHTALYTSYTNKTVEVWRIDLAGTTTNIDFSGFITKFGIGEMSVDTVNTIPVTIRTTGLPTYASP